MKPTNNLKVIRNSISMTQEQLAKKLNTTRSYVSALEDGAIKEPSLGKARLIAYHLGVDINSIFPDKDNLK